MTQTVQMYSSVVVNNTGGADNVKTPKLEAENIHLLASLVKALNDLCGELNKLDRALETENTGKET